MLAEQEEQSMLVEQEEQSMLAEQEEQSMQVLPLSGTDHASEARGIVLHVLQESYF